MFRIFYLLLICFVIITQHAICSQQNHVHELFDAAMTIKMTKPDSSLILLKRCKKTSEELEMTKLYIECLLAEGSIYRERTNMNHALECLYEARYLSEKNNYKLLIIDSYQKIASLHSFFYKYDEAMHFIQKAHKITLQCVDEGLSSSEFLIQSYFELAKMYERNNYKKGLAYIDSCIDLSEKLHKPEIENNYIRTKQASLYLKSGETEKALTLLLKLEDEYTAPNVDEKLKAVLVFIYSHLGQVYQNKKNYTKQLSYCQQSLNAIRKYKIHKGLTEFIYTQMSSACRNLGDNKRAISFLWKARILRNRMFGARNNRNKDFFTLHSDYMKKLEERDQKLMKQDLDLAKKEKTIVLFQGVLISILLVIFAVFLIVRIRIQKMKHHSTKLLIEQKAKEKEKSTNKIIELKNKELTSYNLRFLEREDLFLKMKEYIKRHPDGKKSNELLQTIKNTTTTNWEDFNTRFTSVNEGFYESLKEQCPSLSPTELKHCALIRLNFSSKEMSNLLGISPQSINVSRSRIRQKLKLDRSVNLKSYIADL